MTIYAAIAAAVLPVLPQFAVGGPSFTGTHTTGGNTGAATVTSLGARTLYFIPASLETFVTTFPEARIWAAPWLVFAALGVDIQEGDTYTDGAGHAYRITGRPVTHYGFVLGPATL